jgi:VanZ family protein
MRITASFVSRWGPALLMMAAIFGFSSIPSSEMLNFGLLDYIIKKGGHALGYGLLGLSFLRGLKGGQPRLETRWYYIAWGMAVLFSATDEFHQSFVPGRHPAITDVIIDAVGAALALFLASRYYKQKPASRAGH